jgi:hypothetical protein
MGDLPDDVGRHPGERLDALERVRLDRGGVGVEARRRALDDSRLCSPAWMISRAMPLASATSLPTLRPSHASAHCADDVRRGSTAYILAPLWIALRTWWKKIGWASRAFDPHSRITSVSWIS